MSIWTYSDRSADVDRTKTLHSVHACPYCRTTIEQLRDDVFRPDPRGTCYDVAAPGRPEPDLKVTQRYRVGACPVCGWWRISDLNYSESPWDSSLITFGAIASLRALDLRDVSIALDEIRDYLAASYSSRFNLSPRVFEKTVADVFRNLGYRARVTGVARDGGVDVILDGPEGSTIGVQVKRWRNKVGVAQIRELAGVLLLRGHARGYFVTTSSFTRGAKDEAKSSTNKGCRIELIDAGKFYDALCIVQRSRYSNKEELLESIGSPQLHQVSYGKVEKADPCW